MPLSYRLAIPWTKNTVQMLFCMIGINDLFQLVDWPDWSEHVLCIRLSRRPFAFKLTPWQGLTIKQNLCRLWICYYGNFRHCRMIATITGTTNDNMTVFRIVIYRRQLVPCVVSHTSCRIRLQMERARISINHQHLRCVVFYVVFNLRDCMSTIFADIYFEKVLNETQYVGLVESFAKKKERQMC